VTTLHRPGNVDDTDDLSALLLAITESVRGMTVVFPAHPRTSKAIRAIGSLPSNMLLVEPQPYLEFIYLVKHAKGVITDSGGITEETTVMGIPCMTLRESTERPETVTIGTNELLGIDPKALKPALDRLFAGQWKRGQIPPLWDGQTGARIVAVLERQLIGACAMLQV
jgi:UDP-N-acetylglucosamine 2-epimerase (non-hydrolysing)